MSLHPYFRRRWFKQVGSGSLCGHFIEQLRLLLKWLLIERWGRPSMLSSMCQHVARLQFDSCAEKHRLCGTVMIHDGLNLTFLDQCHGVRSHGTSSSQGWGKRLVLQSKFDRWVYILIFADGDLSRLAEQGLPTEACLCRHQCLFVVAQATAKIRPRPAQRFIFNWKNFIEQL